MFRKLRKSSGRVTLVLIGVAALSGCGEDRRNVYASREDCLADWGKTPQDCTPSTESRHAGRGYFYGPAYAHTWGGNATRSGSSSWRSIGSTSRTSSASSSGSSSRGGFGSSGRSSSSSS